MTSKTAIQVQQALALLALNEEILLLESNVIIKCLEYISPSDLKINANNAGGNSYQIECLLSNHRLQYLSKEQKAVKLETSGFQEINNNLTLDNTQYYYCTLNIEVSNKSSNKKLIYTILDKIKQVVGLTDVISSLNNLGIVSLHIHTQLEDKLNQSIKILRTLGEFFPAFLTNIIQSTSSLKNQPFSLLCEDLIGYYTSFQLIKLCTAPLLLQGINKRISADITVFRYGLKEHYAIQVYPVIGNKLSLKEKQLLPAKISELELSNIPLVRLHSSCFTGDLLESLRCDCHPQLHSSLERIAQHPAGGFIIYLQQEGRGIGLTNKLRTYYLQQYLNLDTSEANRYLGLPDDLREFGLAAKILQYLNVQQLVLLSNNPNKMKELETEGIEVISCFPHIMTKTEEMAKYLAVKAEKFGHKIF